MKYRAACLSALLVLSCSSLAAAGPVADAATRAEKLQAEGKSVEALAALDEAVDSIWTAMPLSFRKVVAVTGSSGYGLYEPAPDHPYKPDETMTVYVEPVGYAYGPSVGDSSTIAFKADLALKNGTGQVLIDSKDVYSVSAPAPVGEREFSMIFRLDVPYLRPGTYQAVFTVHDQNSDKMGTFEVPLEIGLPAGG